MVSVKNRNAWDTINSTIIQNEDYLERGLAIPERKSWGRKNIIIWLFTL